MSTQDEDQLGELPSSRSGQQLNSLLSLPETLRKRSSCMVDNLELGAPLGRGSYGKVYKGERAPLTSPPMHLPCPELTSDRPPVQSLGLASLDLRCASCAGQYSVHEQTCMGVLAIQEHTNSSAGCGKC